MSGIGPQQTLTIAEQDGSPEVTGVHKILFPNSSVVDEGGGIASVEATGTSGISGTSGFSGTSGKSGFSGISGFSGTSGVSGTSGIGTSGVSGASGAGGGGANTATTSVLLSSTSVNLNEGTSAKQALYTCPVSRRSVITNIVMQKASGNSSSWAGCTIGWGGAGSTDVADNIARSLLGPLTARSADLAVADFTNSTNFLSPLPQVGTAGDILGFTVGTPEGSALTVIVDVYGYLTDTSGVPIANVNGTGDGAAIAPASVTTTNGIGVGVAAPSAGLNLDKTITAGGTTGAQTINKPSGTVNFLATATSLVVTNSLVTTSSIIQCTVGTNDTTFKSCQVVAASGSFTIFANAAATAETRVNFTLTN